ncbi:MAG: YfhO family protein [Clostridia bacterium]|nr:YfhO family protein [Clostridia bacterium]
MEKTEKKEKAKQFLEKIKNGIVRAARAAWGFVKPNYPVFVAHLIVLAIYLFMLVSYNVYPFGDKSQTVASYDLSAQICPFIEHLFDVLAGRSSLFYSYSLAGGVDVFGTFMYFFVSPFSVLFLMFGEGMVAHTAPFVMMCKLSAIAVAGAWFAQRLFKGIPRFICTAVGVLYAFCGYTFVSNTYINWMDLMIYAPFCVYAFRRFVQTGKFLAFSILVSVCIYTCFSLVSFSLLTVFPALVCYGLICVEKGKKHRFIADLCLSFVIAVLIALPIMVPSLVSFMGSARGGDLFQNLMWGLSDDGTFNHESFVEWWKGGFNEKWSYLLSDCVFLVLTIAYFFKSRLKTPISKFMLISAVLTLLPTVVDESMNLLNMGSYMCYALRFGFLNVLFFMGGACLFLEDFCYEFNHAYDGEALPAIPKETAKNTSVLADILSFVKKYYGHIACVLAAIFAVVFLYWFLGTDMHIYFWDRYENVEFDPAAFVHTYGGLPTILVIFAVVALVVFVLGLFVVTKKVGLRFAAICLCAVLSVQMVFNGELLVRGNVGTQHTDLKNYTELCDIAAGGGYYRSTEPVSGRETLSKITRNSEYFRVKDYDNRVNNNAPFQTNAASMSVFSSMIDESNFKIATLFRCDTNAANLTSSSGGSFVGDAFFGYQYVVVPQDKTEEIMERGKYYYVPVEYEKDGEVVVAENEQFRLYYNKTAWPLAYPVQGGEFHFSRENTQENSKSNMVEFVRYVTGTHYASVSPLDAETIARQLSERAAEITVGQGKISAHVESAAEGENLLMSFIATKGYKAYVNGKEVELVANDLDLIVVPLEEGENEIELIYTSPYPKYVALTTAGTIALLVAAWFVVKKTKFMEKCAPVISWCGIALGAGVVGFFFLMPFGLWCWKLIRLFFPFFFPV